MQLAWSACLPTVYGVSSDALADPHSLPFAAGNQNAVVQNGGFGGGNQNAVVQNRGLGGGNQNAVIQNGGFGGGNQNAIVQNGK